MNYSCKDIPKPEDLILVYKILSFKFFSTLLFLFILNSKTPVDITKKATPVYLTQSIAAKPTNNGPKRSEHTYSVIFPDRYNENIGSMLACGYVTN